MKSQYRFYVNRDLVSGCSFTAGKELTYQLGRILRLADGDFISLFGSNQKEFLSKVSFCGREITLTPAEDITENREPKCHLTLLLALSKKDKPEFAVQKCTELGVVSFIFVCSDRSVVKCDAAQFEAKLERLNKVAWEAAEQCGRITVPKISFQNLKNIDYSIYEKRIVCSSPSASVSLKQIKSENILAAVGPEGGFSDNELKFFEEKGFESVHLGSLVLRAETAAISAASCLLID